MTTIRYPADPDGERTLRATLRVLGRAVKRVAIGLHHERAVVRSVTSDAVDSMFEAVVKGVSKIDAAVKDETPIVKALPAPAAPSRG